MISESYHDPQNLTLTALSEDHARMLFKESGIAPEVAAERGYYTITERSEFPPGFGKNKRRVPALGIPVYSPNGTTSFVRVRHGRPRPTYKLKKGRWVRDSETRYDQPNGQGIIPDVHPHNMERVKDLRVPLWITEGEKKGDCLTSHGECVVTLTGVNCWGKGGELLRDWDHIALNGRTVYVVYDSDVMVNPKVQSALEGLVGALEARGAMVKVIYLPDAQDGTKQGVDDYLVAGGTVETLYEMAQTFEKSDYTKVRLSRNKRLRAAVEDMWKVHDALPTKTERECSCKAVFRAHARRATSKGWLNKKGELVYDLPSLDGAISVNVSQPTFSRHTKGLLQEKGHLRVERPKDDTKANRYIWSCPPGGWIGNKSGGELGQKRTSGSLRGEEKFSSGSSSHSYSQITPLQDEVPEFRHSRVIVSWKEDDAGFRVCEVDPLVRLSSRRREIIVYLLIHGRTSKETILARFASEKATWKNFKRDVLGPMVKQFPILAVEDGFVSLREDWREGVEKARLAGQEEEDQGKQIVKSELKRAAFRNKDNVKPDRAPTEAEMDRRRKEREAIREEADEVFEDLELVKDPAPDDQDQEPAVEGADPVPDHREPVLSGEDRQILEAIRAYELKFGPGSFRWDVASCKAMFYQMPGGCWPTPAELDRIRLYVAAAEEVAA